MKDCTPLHVLKTIVTAGRNELPGTATGILYGTIVDQTSNKHQVESPNLIVSDLGRKVLPFPVAMKRGIITIFEEGNPHMRKSGVVVSVQQRNEGLGMISFKFDIDAGNGASLPGIVNVL